MIDRLQSHYGFTRPPFSKTLTPGQLHHHAGHNQAVARITWCVTARSIGLLAGESGAGKTVAARAAIAALDQTRHTLIYLANPTTGARGICHHIVTSLGGVPRFQNAALYPQAADALAAENAERGRLPVLIIDEAHLLDHHQLELVRLLTNAEMDAASPLAVILIGQPTLKRMMKLGVLAALDQRIAVRYTLALAAYAQLRIACTMATDLRRPWHRKPEPGTVLSPYQTRLGFRRLRTQLGSPTKPAKFSRPGPGRPKESKNRPKAPRPPHRKTTKPDTNYTK